MALYYLHMSQSFDIFVNIQSSFFWLGNSPLFDTVLNPDFIERSQKNGTNQILLAAFSNTQTKVSRTGQLLVKLLHFLCRYQRSDSEGRGEGECGCIGIQ